MTQSTFQRLRLPALVLIYCLCAQSAFGWFAKEQPVVQVTDPFIEMHTGPGRGYPVFYVAGEGEQIKRLKRRTDWFKVELKRGEHTIKRGWVPLAQMRATLDLDGAEVDYGVRWVWVISQRAVGKRDFQREILMVRERLKGTWRTV